MSSLPPITQTGTGTSSNPFVAPAIDTKKPFEPPEFSVIRDLLSRKFIEMEMNPFGVAGANTGGGLPLPPSWSPYGVGGAPQGSSGAMWNPMTGAYGGGNGAPAPGGPAPPPPGAATALAGAIPQESPQPTHDGEGRPWYDDGSHGPQAPGVQKGYDAGWATYGGGAPNEGATPPGSGTQFGTPNDSPATGPAVTNLWNSFHEGGTSPAAAKGLGAGATPTESSNFPNGSPGRTMNDKTPFAPGSGPNISSAFPGQGTNSSNPLLASLAQQNEENAGNGPNKAWNSTAKNNPWAGMNQDQFRTSMADNVGGSGVGGLENIAGPGWQNAPQVNIPGLTYTGANHELGGNPYIGAAGARAGMTPQQMALWTLQGYQRTQNNPIQGNWVTGPGGGQTWQQTSGYNMPGTQSVPPQSSGSGPSPGWGSTSGWWNQGPGSTGPTSHSDGVPRYDAPGGQTGTGGVGGTDTNVNPTGPGSPAPTANTSTGGNPWATSGGFPWTQAYQGQFTAPLNQTEQGAMSQYQNYINGLGGGAPGAPQNAPTNFASLYASGPGANSDATMNSIQNAAQGWQNYENQEALRRIGSSAAAGGGALSGANMQAQADYLNNANNLFNQTMGTMRLQNAQYGQGLQNALLQSQIGAQATMGAAGEYAGAQEYGSGLGYQENQQALQNQALQNLFGMGQVGQNTEQNQYNAAYNDWLRQTGNMQNMYTYPDQMGLSQLAYGQYGANSQPNAYGTSSAAQWQALLSQLLGGGAGGSTNGLLNQVISGYNQGQGTTTGQDATPRYDGFKMGHDGVLYDGGSATSPSLSSLTQGRDYWLNRLNQSEASSAAGLNAGQPSAGQQTASGILALLNLLMGGQHAGGGGGTAMTPAAGGGAISGGAAGGSGGLGLIGLLAKGVGALLKPSGQSKPGAPAGMSSSPNPYGTGTSTGTDPTTGLPAGASMTTDPNSLLQLGIIDPNNYNMAGQPNVIDPNNQNQSLADYLSSIPTDYQSTTGTYGGTPDNLPGGYGQSLDVPDPSASD